MNLFQEFEERKIDYKSLQFQRQNAADEVDVSIIIPVNGRIQFNNIITKRFLFAAAHIDYKIAITFVEHGPVPLHRDIMLPGAGYIWIPQGESRFNKCLCFNVGVLYGPKAKYYLFHDCDILVPKLFFSMLFENCKTHDAVQAFSGQRLFHCDYYLTENLLKEFIHINDLEINTRGVTPARAGAEGGSIFCKQDILLKTGLFPDWGFDEYSVEDSYFFRCLQLMGSVGYCDSPPIDCFHLYHPPSFGRQTKDSDWQRYYAFMAMNEEGKRHYCKLASDHFKKYL